METLTRLSNYRSTYMNSMFVQCTDKILFVDVESIRQEREKNLLRIFYGTYQQVFSDLIRRVY